MTQDQDKKKIISVTMSQSLVSRIDDLVKERVGRSRAQMIEDSVRWYLDFTVHKWNERGLYWNAIRMILSSESLSSLFFSKLTPNDQYELGITAGSQAPIADVMKIFHRKDPTKKESYEFVMSMLQDSGWGELRLQDKMIVVGSPFYPAPFLRGYFESLLKLKLELVETNVKDNIAFRIK
ncbi:MAG: ribbon-helix-helix protein, CopG family [Candidatus Thorarchaeota archaeon]|nr:MAG: ribbon-helix-helix protein, CopG family [Candidatus Thorarchaeota archaeon]